MELPVNTGGVGGGDYPFKADVMDAFLRDSLHVAKSTVTTEVIGKLKRTDDAAASEPHLAFAERVRSPPRSALSLASIASRIGCSA
jgi:hypothetical protein